MRLKGASNVYAYGDCTLVDERPLPATAQVASQQAAYIARLFSKGYDMHSKSSPTKPPSRAKPKQGTATDVDSGSFSDKIKVGRLTASDKYISSELSKSSNDEDIEFAKPFQFLNLGVLAYLGASQALAQVSVNDKNILGAGSPGFYLWRGIYWFKQVSWRNRALVALDWIKAKMYGRDIGSLY